MKKFSVDQTEFSTSLWPALRNAINRIGLNANRTRTNSLAEDDFDANPVDQSQPPANHYDTAPASHYDTDPASHYDTDPASHYDTDPAKHYDTDPANPVVQSARPQVVKSVGQQVHQSPRPSVDQSAKPQVVQSTRPSVAQSARPSADQSVGPVGKAARPPAKQTIDARPADNQSKLTSVNNSKTSVSKIVCHSQPIKISTRTFSLNDDDDEIDLELLSAQNKVRGKKKSHN